jgi:hypothetical protein
MANQQTALWRRVSTVTRATRLPRCLGLALLVLTVGIVSASAQTASRRLSAEPELRTSSITAMGGVFSKGNLGETINPFVEHESNYLLGLTYARDFVSLAPQIALGGEIGYAARFGQDRGSSELWASLMFRHRGFPVNTFTLAPAFGFGASGVTRSIGVESERVDAHRGNASVLFHFTAELAFRSSSWKNFELIYRIHHRSGFYGVLGDLKEGSNANVIGLRWYR